MRQLTQSQQHDFDILYNYLRIDSDRLEVADVIVVGGSGSRTDMADRAADLYREGYAPVIVFSGFAHPHYGVNEAKLLANRAIKLGVPESVILLETQATNTGLNVVLSEKLLESHNIIPNSVILVHKPYMTRRFLATAQAQWLQPLPKFYVTSIEASFDDYLRLEESRNLADRTLVRILNDYRSIKEYPKLGFSVEQPQIPEVEDAYERLIKAGFSHEVADPSLATKNYQ